MRVLVIAEPGCTAQGDKATMLRLLETAAQCGANVWKPQFVSDPVQMCERRQMRDDPAAPANNQKFANASDEFAYYKRAYSWLAWPVEWHAEFRDRCHALGMEYAVTCFLPVDVWMIEPFVDMYKRSSFEMADVGLLWTMQATRKPIVFSIGMADIAPIDVWGAVKVLQCTSQYPAPLDAVNLAVIRTARLHGLSDHSRHLLTGALAVACGAQIIETHYRLDDCDPTNPDYAVAFTPAEFTQYILNIRDAEVMLGSGEKQIQPCERDMLPYRVTG